MEIDWLRFAEPNPGSPMKVSPEPSWAQRAPVRGVLIAQAADVQNAVAPAADHAGPPPVSKPPSVSACAAVALEGSAAVATITPRIRTRFRRRGIGADRTPGPATQS